VSRSLNKVSSSGIWVQIPRYAARTTAPGVGDPSVADQRQWTGNGGEKQKRLEWHRVICWNNKVPAWPTSPRRPKKGDKVYIEMRSSPDVGRFREKQTRLRHRDHRRWLISCWGPEVGVGRDWMRAGAGKGPRKLAAKPRVARRVPGGAG